MISLPMPLCEREHDSAKLAPERKVSRHGTGNERPKFAGMIHLSQMADLMHNDVIGEVRGKRRYFVVETQITLLRAASPAPPLGAYCYFGERNSIDPGKILAPLMYEYMRRTLERRDVAAGEPDDVQFPISLHVRLIESEILRVE